MQSTLIVNKLKKNVDSGEYKCTAIDHNSKSSFKAMAVEIWGNYSGII